TLKVSIYGSIAGRVLKIPRIVNAISGLGYNFIENREGILQKFIKFFMKLAFRSPRVKFIFQSSDDLDIFKKLNIIGRDNVFLIKGSGVDLKEYAHTPIPKDGIVKVAITARLLYDKGIVEFVRAAQS